MKQIFGSHAYSDGPRENCWWDQTVALASRPAFGADQSCDVAIVGGGFTGISAALELARAGVNVVVLEARYIGWGASGRNGGFCCLGGGRLSDAVLDKQVGRRDRLKFRAAELAAIEAVENLTTTHKIDVDRHSDGETELAHRPQDMERLRARIPEIKENYGLDAGLIEKHELGKHGLSGPFHGALTIPAGFALNPRKLIAGMATAAETAGAKIYHDTTVQHIGFTGGRHQIKTAHGTLLAEKVIVGTNGYSSEDVPPALAGRYMPAQSSVIVTAPLTDAELARSGWTSRQMVFDTRHLLHYFRLMPDNRMLFGMRGGLTSGAAADARSIVRVRRDFDKIFPEWQDIKTPYGWSGMVCLSRAQMPFVGKLPAPGNIYAALGYHGNGVAMGTYSGALVADLALGRHSGKPFADVMQRPMQKFELGRYRRAMMPFAYLGFALADR